MRQIRPDCTVEDFTGDILSTLPGEVAEISKVDVIINASASLSVTTALEKYFGKVSDPHPPIVSFEVGHTAEYALATLVCASYSGGPLSVDRKLKLAVANSVDGGEFLEEFWPLRGSRKGAFQPEPGCSDPTFVGSAADVTGMAARLLNIVSQWLGNSDANAHGCVIRADHLPALSSARGFLQWQWPKDRELSEHRMQFRVRISATAERDLIGWIREGQRRRGRQAETGGLLFGEVDEFNKVIWIDEVSGPPSDSRATSTEFVCGIRGNYELNSEKSRRTRDSVRFVGMWHTHPDGPALPSTTDLQAMKTLRESAGSAKRWNLMLIVGGCLPGLSFEGYLFDR
jgi:proteasome lid subunit RPN8/RPN11